MDAYVPLQYIHIHVHVHRLFLAGVQPIQFDSIRFDSVRFGSIQFDSIRFNSIQFNSIQFKPYQINSSFNPSSKTSTTKHVWFFLKFELSSQNESKRDQGFRAQCAWPVLILIYINLLHMWSPFSWLRVKPSFASLITFCCQVSAGSLQCDSSTHSFITEKTFERLKIIA